MSVPPPGSRKPQGIFFWSPLGGGHKTAKEALQEEKRAEYNNNIDVTTYDVDFTKKILNSIYIPFLGPLGDLGAKQWNNAQKEGNLKFLSWTASLTWVGEILLYPLVYFKVKHMLESMKEEPKFLIMTQAAGVSAIAHAVLSVNKRRNWNVKVDVHMTDIPSNKAVHFNTPLKLASLNSSLRDIIRLHAPKPHTKKDESEEAFWKKHCGNIQVIHDDHYPIRKEFLNTDVLKEKLNQDTLEIGLQLNHPSEEEIIKKGVDARFYQIENTTANISIKKEDRVGFIMLGSQPTTASVLNWVNSFIASPPTSQSDSSPASSNNKFLFIYCGEPRSKGDNKLLNEIEEYINNLKAQDKLPKNFNLIPFTNQSAQQIATLMARSDVSVTRSGGATTMELLTLFETGVCSKEKKTTFIHSEAMQYNTELVYAKNNAASRINTLFQNRFFQNISQDREEIQKEIIDIFRKRGWGRRRSTETADAILQSALSGNSRFIAIPEVQKIKDGINRFIDTDIPYLQQRQKNIINSRVEQLQQKEKYSESTAEELEKKAKEKILIEKGMFLWEGKNAKCLVSRVGAIITNPELAKEHLAHSFFT